MYMLLYTMYSYNILKQGKYRRAPKKVRQGPRSNVATALASAVSVCLLCRCVGVSGGVNMYALHIHMHISVYVRLCISLPSLHADNAKLCQTVVGKYQCKVAIFVGGLKQTYFPEFAHSFDCMAKRFSNCKPISSN